MKKKSLKVLVLLLMMLVLVPKNVYAIMGICTGAEKEKLVNKTKGVKISYKPVKTDENKYEYSIQILNMPSFTYAEIDGFDEQIENLAGASSVALDFTLPGNKTYKIKFYVLPKQTCEDELVWVKSFSLPKYNIYSELDECVEYEEFPLCNIYYKGEIKNLKEFKDKLEEYKESLKSEQIEEEKELSVFEKIVKFYTGNLVITLPVTIALIGGGVFALFKFVILKNKSKKIGIDEFIE